MGDRDVELRLLEPAPPTGGRRAEPRLAWRLTPWLVCGLVLTAAVYVTDTARQPSAAERVARQVTLLSTVLAVSAEDLLQQDRAAQLDHLLGAALQADEVFAALVLGPAGVIVAGGAADLSCVPGELPLQLPAHELAGRLDCGADVHWSATPLLAEQRWLIVGLTTSREGERGARRGGDVCCWWRS